LASECYITLFSGVGKIGGNSLLVKDKESMTLLDLRKDFDRYKKFFQFQKAFHKIFKDNTNVIIPEKNLPMTISG
jgi:hypothetical protein